MLPLTLGVGSGGSMQLTDLISVCVNKQTVRKGWTLTGLSWWILNGHFKISMVTCTLIKRQSQRINPFDLVFYTDGIPGFWVCMRKTGRSFSPRPTARLPTGPGRGGRVVESQVNKFEQVCGGHMGTFLMWSDRQTDTNENITFHAPGSNLSFSPGVLVNPRTGNVIISEILCVLNMQTEQEYCYSYHCLFHYLRNVKKWKSYIEEGLHCGNIF